MCEVVTMMHMGMVVMGTVPMIMYVMMVGMVVATVFVVEDEGGGSW